LCTMHTACQRRTPSVYWSRDVGGTLSAERPVYMHPRPFATFLCCLPNWLQDPHTISPMCKGGGQGGPVPTDHRLDIEGGKRVRNGSMEGPMIHCAQSIAPMKWGSSQKSNLPTTNSSTSHARWHAVTPSNPLAGQAQDRSPCRSDIRIIMQTTRRNDVPVDPCQQHVAFG